MEIYSQIFEIFFSKLKEETPSYYTYHTPEHTQYVIEKAIMIGKEENIQKKEIELLKIAALFHDMGFLRSRENHEETACEMVSQELPSWDFSTYEISQICGMIRATKIPQRPISLLDKIIADADLEYLGTDLYEVQANNLYKELIYFNPTLTKKEWLEIQVNFLSTHRFHTEFCINNRDPKKQEHLKRLKCNFIEF
ncbi:HD domain-containing protein [Shivajiella indica]|uniref:HD domain-containing protein n=1 Tax=Shivajiella indica TaxID=872115 RepID=A0ABW5B4I3_9BACT